MPRRVEARIGNFWGGGWPAAISEVAKQGCTHILNMYGEIWSWVSWRVAPEHFGPFWHLSPRGCRVAGAGPGRVAGLPGRSAGRVSAGLPGAAGRGRVLPGCARIGNFKVEKGGEGQRRIRQIERDVISNLSRQSWLDLPRAMRRAR